MMLNVVDKKVMMYVGVVIWILIMLIEWKDVRSIDGNHIDLPTQILGEESREVFFTNFVYFFAGTNEGAGFYVLAKLTRVVFAP